MSSRAQSKGKMSNTEKHAQNEDAPTASDQTGKKSTLSPRKRNFYYKVDDNDYANDNDIPLDMNLEEENNDGFISEFILKSDAELLGSLVQIVILMVLLVIEITDLFFIYQNCNNSNNWSVFFTKKRCKLSNCHVSIIVLMIFVINLITAASLIYDKKQANTMGFRLKEWYIILIMFLGGWITAWSLMLTQHGIYKNSNLLFKRSAIAASVLSMSGPFLFCIIYYS